MNKEERKIYMQEYRKTEKWKISKKLSDKKYYQNNKNKIQEINKKWKQENLEKFYEINKEWNKNNPEKIKESQKKYRQNNPSYKIRNIFHNLKKQNYKNLEKPEFEHIKQHIENNFINNMNWNNIEIDHKVPISWFKKEPPLNLINNLDNLHPLFKEENRKKAASYCHPISIEYYNKILPYVNEKNKDLLIVSGPTEERVKMIVDHIYRKT